MNRNHLGLPTPKLLADWLAVTWTPLMRHESSPDSAPKPPHCPSCAQPMRLLRRTARLFGSRLGTRTARRCFVPSAQMDELRSYFDVCQTVAEVDRDQRSDVGNREAVAGNELMSVQFMIHPFKTLISHRSLRLAVFRELLETSLKDRTGILKRASDRS